MREKPRELNLRVKATRSPRKVSTRVSNPPNSATERVRKSFEDASESDSNYPRVIRRGREEREEDD